jgi:hypothetical protein
VRADSRLTSQTPQRRQNARSAVLAVPQSQQATWPHSAQAAPSAGRAAPQASQARSLVTPRVLRPQARSGHAQTCVDEKYYAA